MRVAAIDAGTNSVRLLVAEDRPGGLRTLDRRMVITRLGQGVDRSRMLSSEALTRTLQTIADYAATCGEYDVRRLRITGTSAVRDARNRDVFLSAVRDLTGQEPELLTGEQEARVTFAGVLSDLVEAPMVVVDIGGGSTELIYGHGAPEKLMSLDVGCVRMFEKHLSSDPPADAELEALRSEVMSELHAFKNECPVPAGTRFVGVAGTVTQLAALKSGLPLYDPEVTHQMVLSHGDVRLLARRLERLPLEKRRRVKALEPGRADVIVAGVEILQCVMETFDVGEIVVSEKDILDGLVIELLERSEP
jgi:exopolyphosphatase/guanosine-5'-triphosphate,3'-diphosphate pyrophosphatase